MSKDIDILNTFLLAGIPEIISKEEFNEVKQAIKNLIELNQKYESGEIFSSKQIKLVEKGIKIGAETTINKEMKNFVSKRKLEELLDIDEIGVIHCRIKQWLEK